MKPSTYSGEDFLKVMPTVLYEYRKYFDGGGKFLYMSPNCESIFGAPAEYFLEDTERLWKLVHPDDRGRLRNEDENSKLDTPFTSEVRIHCQDNQFRWIRLVSRPILSTKTDTSTIWAGYITDITEHKATELRRTDLIRGLENALAEIKDRDLKLTRANEELKETQGRLKAKNKQLDEFAQVVAHDLNTVINNVVGYTSVLLETASETLDEESYGMLKEAFSNANKMSDIIRELLAFSRVGKESVEITDIPMKEIFLSAMSRLKHLIDARSATIEVGELSYRSRGYGPWLEEVWYNYLSNALKYGGDPPVIEVGSETGKDSIMFWIKDNGKGMDPDELSRVFDKDYYQRLKIIKGHGLGLGIVKEIVKELDGSVWATSNPGHGSCFYFSLPIGE